MTKKNNFTDKKQLEVFIRPPGRGGGGGGGQ